MSPDVEYTRPPEKPAPAPESLIGSLVEVFLGMVGVALGLGLVVLCAWVGWVAVLVVFCLIVGLAQVFGVFDDK